MIAYDCAQCIFSDNDGIALSFLTNHVYLTFKKKYVYRLIVTDDDNWVMAHWVRCAMRC